ncbi:MAG: PhoH family protein [Alphaproteobacteria bacterium]|nr:MAG: PhoH family protein [Alphaproteobacteria bacterium]
MGKKSKVANYRANRAPGVERVHKLFGAGDWDPLGGYQGHRDQSYVKNVRPRSEGQKRLMEAIEKHNLVLAIGPAGTGKTYLAVTAAVEAFEKGKVERIILSRPAVEAGEKIGYLPGDLQDKMAPYLRPLYDALNDRMGIKRLKSCIESGEIEIAPIGYMRGRTLNNAYVVIDEAQNCTYGQIKMIVSRLGWNSTMIITGDPDQSDLLDGISGLRDMAAKLEKVEGIAVERLKEVDIVRHPLVAKMLEVI